MEQKTLVIKIKESEEYLKMLHKRLQDETIPEKRHLEIHEEHKKEREYYKELNSKLKEEEGKE